MCLPYPTSCRALFSSCRFIVVLSCPRVIVQSKLPSSVYLGTISECELRWRWRRRLWIHLFSDAYLGGLINSEEVVVRCKWKKIYQSQRNWKSCKASLNVDLIFFVFIKNKYRFETCANKLRKFCLKPYILSKIWYIVYLIFSKRFYCCTFPTPFLWSFAQFTRL